MDKRLQEMLDHFEIRKTLSEYCRGVDRGDQEHMASVYAQGSWDEHGPFRSSGPDFAKAVMNVMKNGASNRDSHMLGQSVINIDGDKAGAETYFLATSKKDEADGSEVLLQLAGRYVDQLVREDGMWKIKNRVCVRDWSVTLPITADWMTGMGFVEAQRSGEDPSFAVLGVKHSGVPGF